jgi:hypothetical protein
MTTDADSRMVEVSEATFVELMNALQPTERWTQDGGYGLVLWTLPSKKLVFVRRREGL